MTNSTTQKGYTLVEMLVYVAVVCFTAVIVVTSLLGIGKAYLTYKVSEDVSRGASFALERLVREARDATSVDTGASTLLSGTSTLVLNTKTDAGADTTITFSIQDGVLSVREGGGAYQPLTGKGVVTTAFHVSHFVGPRSEAVRIKAEFQRTRGVVSKSGTFWTGVVLRGSYIED